MFVSLCGGLPASGQSMIFRARSVPNSLKLLLSTLFVRLSDVVSTIMGGWVHRKGQAASVGNSGGYRRIADKMEFLAPSALVPMQQPNSNKLAGSNKKEPLRADESPIHQNRMHGLEDYSAWVRRTSPGRYFKYGSKLVLCNCEKACAI